MLPLVDVDDAEEAVETRLLAAVAITDGGMLTDLEKAMPMIVPRSDSVCRHAY